MDFKLTTKTSIVPDHKLPSQCKGGFTVVAEITNGLTWLTWMSLYFQNIVNSLSSWYWCLQIAELSVCCRTLYFIRLIKKIGNLTMLLIRSMKITSWVSNSKYITKDIPLGDKRAMVQNYLKNYIYMIINKNGKYKLLKLLIF